MASRIEQADLNIVGGFSADPISKISSSRSINLYPAFHHFGKKQWALHPTPGTQIQTSIGLNEGPVRGAYVFNNIAYFCSNNALFQMDSGYLVTPLGLLTFTTDSGFVRIVSNQFQILFTDGITLFLWDTVALTLTDITASVGFPPGVLPTDITYMDGYFILVNGLNNRFYVSKLDDGATWQALQFAQINSTADFMVGCERLKRRIFLFGRVSTEVWLDAGEANFAFRRDNNLLFEHGLESVGSLVEGFDRLFYLSRNENGVDSIKMVEGTVPVDISTYELNLLIQKLPNTNKAIGTIKKQDGIIFYKISIDNRTFVYNVTMSNAENRLWHEELMWERQDDLMVYKRHIENCHIFFNGLHFIGDYRSSSLFLYSKELFDNDGDSIKRQVITKTFSDPNYRYIRINRIQVDMLQGVGVPGTDSTETEDRNLYHDQAPFIELYISTDGGETYFSRDISKIGELGRRKYRTFWNQIGNERQYIFSWITFNSVPIYILGASIKYEVGFE